ncbi:MAG: 2-C-methyl-D-erythritol 4-phosphate cytidylyltransferase [Oscillospiraceae bacterium]|jgi:2-C-methyl-D-erythritol 4-phosphate cytidylyltransferase|nr:2-C-methyl-D-erythritol 4-phosphate cytidylyltransferase [Oscillospiraceae bacterium]
MIFAGIVAGGTGTRMGGDIPKQFLPLGEKPIIIHTIEKFLLHPFDAICVGVHENWRLYAQDIFRKFKLTDKRLILATGGSIRNETIMSIIEELETKFGSSDEHILVTHDAVRPFITLKVIQENIKSALKFGACDTCVCSHDTIIESDQNKSKILNIPDRKFMFLGQTPQSFNMQKLKRLYNNLSDKEKSILTDACRIFVMRNEPVKIVEGEFSNIKITNLNDYRVAQSLLTEPKTI